MLNVNPTCSTIPHTEKEAERLARYVARHGLDKKARSSSWGRLWVSLSIRPGYICVGAHGKGQPLVTVRREEL